MDWPASVMPTTSIETASTGGASENTYQELLAASALPVKWAEINGTLSDGTNAGDYLKVLAYGAGGSETIIQIERGRLGASASDGNFGHFTLRADINLPTASRFAWKFDHVGGTQGVTANVGFACGEGIN